MKESDWMNKVLLVWLIRNHAPKSWSSIWISAQELGDASLLFDSNEVARLSDADGLPVPPFVPATRPDPSKLAAISKELQQWELQGIKLHTVLCSSYPANLRSVFDCPPLIFTKGSLAVIDAHGVAVVGTRKASREGLARATKLARELTESKITVYSGLAAGIDAAAHAYTPPDSHGWETGEEFLVRDLGYGILLIPSRPGPISELDDVLGCTGYSGPALSVEEMDTAIRNV